MSVCAKPTLAQGTGLPDTSSNEKQLKHQSVAKWAMAMTPFSSTLEENMTDRIPLQKPLVLMI